MVEYPADTIGGTIADIVGRPLSRRTFLGGVGVAGGAAVLVRSDTAPVSPALGIADDPHAGEMAHLVTPVKPDLTITVERDVDLLLLDFLFYGFVVDTSSRIHALRATTPGSTVVVRFPPQAIAEAAYHDPQEPASNPTGLAMDPSPVLSALSGSSQLAFAFGVGDRIPLMTGSAKDLLDWSGWSLAVPPVAQSAAHAVAPPVPHQPTQFETAIEFPYALYLAPSVHPSSTTTFVNRSRPVVSASGTSDLFSSTLTTTQLGIEVDSSVSAVWSRDVVAWNPGAPAVAGDVTPPTAIVYGSNIIK